MPVIYFNGLWNQIDGSHQCKTIQIIGESTFARIEMSRFMHEIKKTMVFYIYISRIERENSKKNEIDEKMKAKANRYKWMTLLLRK